jgi:hypothetical protein
MGASGSDSQNGGLEMNDRPSAVELLEAAREHLVGRVIPGLKDPVVRYQTLVAAHVLSVVAREIEHGDSHSESTRGEMLSLLEAMAQPTDPAPTLQTLDAQLCQLIREGQFDQPSRTRALVEHLARRVERSLAVWNPAFLHRVRSGQTGS